MDKEINTNKIFLDLETEGLSPWFDQKITCICAKDSQNNIFQQSLKDQEENDLIKNFINWILERKDHTLVFHNGISFDIPFLLTRAVINGFSIPKIDFITRMNYFDTIKIVYKWFKLDELATLYGIKNKTGNGKLAIQQYQNGDFESLENYCMNDVEITEQVYNTYLKLNNKE